jgi:hypothetical protein
MLHSFECGLVASLLQLVRALPVMVRQTGNAEHPDSAVCELREIHSVLFALVEGVQCLALLRGMLQHGGLHLMLADRKTSVEVTRYRTASIACTTYCTNPRWFGICGEVRVRIWGCVRRGELRDAMELSLCPLDLLTWPAQSLRPPILRRDR